MQLSEFKAWFEGFSEGIDKTPNAKQWERIKEKIALIDGTPITEKVYIDRWYPYINISPKPHRYEPWIVYGNFTADSSQQSFNSHQAMYTLGKTEIKETLV